MANNIVMKNNFKKSCSYGMTTTIKDFEIKNMVCVVYLSSVKVVMMVLLLFFLDHISICKILLENNADINATTNGSLTPLHFASLSQENIQILEMFLLRPDIDINIKNNAGDLAYDLAYRSGPQVELFELVNKGLKI